MAGLQPDGDGAPPEQASPHCGRACRRRNTWPPATHSHRSCAHVPVAVSHQTMQEALEAASRLLLAPVHRLTSDLAHERAARVEAQRQARAMRCVPSVIYGAEAQLSFVLVVRPSLSSCAPSHCPLHTSGRRSSRPGGVSGGPAARCTQCRRAGTCGRASSGWSANPRSALSATTATPRSSQPRPAARHGCARGGQRGGRQRARRGAAAVAPRGNSSRGRSAPGAPSQPRAAAWWSQ